MLVAFGPPEDKGTSSSPKRKEDSRPDLLKVLHHEAELLHVSLVALLPRFLLFAAGVPAQALHHIMFDGRAAVVFGRLPGQGHRVLGHQGDLQLGRRVRWVCKSGILFCFFSRAIICTIQFTWVITSHTL